MTTWADIFWKYVRKGCDRSDAAYRADLWKARQPALATATGTAKTPKAVECEASQSGLSASEGNAQ